jgi:DNA-binding LacI/PurR family transcriptional regulator
VAKPAETTLTERVTDSLRRRIADGRLKAGQRLPSEESLRREFGVSRVTVRRGLRLLRDERLLESRAGVGHFVAAGAGPAPRLPGAGDGCTEVLYVHDVGRAVSSLKPLGAAIFAGALEEAGRVGLDLFVCCLEATRLRQLVREKKGATLGGVLFDWNDPDLARFLMRQDVPFVVVDGDFDELPVAAVIQDNVAGTIAALEHLAGLGHRRIALLGPDDGWVHSRRRLAGYREFHLRRDWPLDEALVAREPGRESEGHAAAERLLGGARPPTAVFVADRHHLRGLLEVAAARGLAVPGDLSVVVWGEAEPGAPNRELSHVNWDRAEMGRLAVRLLAERAAGDRTEKAQVLISAKLVERGSTAGPRPGGGGARRVRGG